MEKKFYMKSWFIITMIIVFFPVGLYLMWKYTNWSDNTKKIVTGLFGVLLVISIFTQEEIITYSSEYTYETEAIPAQEEVTETVENITTEINGDYVIGIAPADYATGDEKEFTTSQSGNYIAGEDFPAGVYDITPVSGGGNVQGTDLNLIMGTAGGDFYTDYFDNKEFKEGDTLKVSGVSVKLTPQNDDEFYIPEGTYNLTAVKGGGNVQGSGLNEIMGTEGGNFYVKNYDNAQLISGRTLSLNGVSLELEPKEKEIVVQEAVEAVPSEEIVETYTITNEEGATPTCTINEVTKNCDSLKNLDKLEEDISSQMTENEK